MKNMMRHPDPGLQPERTVMAWTRTLVSFLVVAGLSMRVSASIHDAAFTVITVIAGIAALNIMCANLGVIGALMMDWCRKKLNLRRHLSSSCLRQWLF